MLIRAWIAWKSYDMPGNNIKYIGITGTDGKSSSSYMTYHLLKSAGYRVGILSTVYIDIGDGILDNHSKLTSLSRGDFW
jgi:UDP-N-acetylmuramoyl-L-alanyl-D-glutamate--2,6-diaminopimelate ligase